MAKWPETTFVKRDGSTMSIRLSDDTTDAYCRAAKNLNARFFVAVDHAWIGPVWGIFDMDRAQENNPRPGVWSTEDPIKRFDMNCLDAAVMFAVMMVERR